MADLEANFMHLQLMHESLARFGESFAAFLYGLNVRAFCVDFPEAPVAESFERWRGKMDNSGIGGAAGSGEGETTFMYIDAPLCFLGCGLGDDDVLIEDLNRTTDTSFVEQGSTSISSKATTTPRRAPPPPVTPRTMNSMRTTGPGTRGLGRGSAGGRGNARVVRGSGLARPRGRGIR